MSDKESIQQSDDDSFQSPKYCHFCSKKAEFKCGNCEAATYCSVEHQKIDWVNHRSKCISPKDRLIELKKQSKHFRKKLFDKLIKSAYYEAQTDCEEIVKIQKQVSSRFPNNPMHEIEYGSAVCAHSRILMNLKNINEAQQTVTSYLKQRKNFLTNTKDIPDKLKKNDPKFTQKKDFIEGKLKLLSTLSHLVHQLDRNSVEILHILLQHCEKYFGYYSLEVANIYYEIGNYYHNILGQPDKAIACFWIAGKIRKEKGGVSFYNVGILFAQKGEYKKAKQFLQKALDFINKSKLHTELIGNIHTYLGVINIRLNNTIENCIPYFQKSLCFFSYNNANDPNYKISKGVLKEFQYLIRKQYDDDQTMTLPKQSLPTYRPIIISNKNYDDYWNIDKNEDQNKKKEEWKESFKRQNQRLRLHSKIPLTSKLIENTLFKNNFLQNKKEALFSNNEYEVQLIIDESFISSLDSVQVSFLVELNRILAQNKDKSAVHDLVENSNLIQCLTPAKIERLYELNPQIKKNEYKEIVTPSKLNKNKSKVKK